MKINLFSRSYYITGSWLQLSHRLATVEHRFYFILYQIIQHDKGLFGQNKYLRLERDQTSVFVFKKMFQFKISIARQNGKFRQRILKTINLNTL